ncbi:amino acid permease 6-like [Prosopis cineraria]|uniref:amino acid permease 6-like n=1 Tax=Prosopis cineraria TaxID=364024 RepID=UPI00240FB176|nr:amino acid permease 6-like [Prosopis cineraria]
MAQLGWLIGLTIIFAFAGVNLYTTNLLADSYRSPDPVTDKRNYSYMETVKNILRRETILFLWDRSFCPKSSISTSSLGSLSIIAAVTSVGYASISVGLSLATIIQVEYIICYLKVCGTKQDTLKSSPPENETMKAANRNGIDTMTIMFLLYACSGRAAFGPHTPGSILMASGFHEPFWLVDLANVLIVVHLAGVYQVITPPIFRVVETMAGQKWPNSGFVTKEYRVDIGKKKLSMNMLRLVWRITFVVVLTVLGMAMPFFNDMLAVPGAIGFWPSVIYFPMKMTIARQKIQQRSLKWFGLQTLDLFCFLVSLAAASAAIHGINQALGRFKPFMHKEWFACVSDYV